MLELYIYGYLNDPIEPAAGGEAGRIWK